MGVFVTRTCFRGELHYFTVSLVPRLVGNPGDKISGDDLASYLYIT